MTECDMFINNEFSNPTQTPPNMSIVSTTEENTLSYISLLSFFLEYFLGHPWIFINLTVWGMSFFVDLPSFCICQMSALLWSRLHVFSKNVTEMMLCSYGIYWWGICDLICPITDAVPFAPMIKAVSARLRYNNIHFFFPLMLTNEHFVGRYSANILFLIEVQVINLLVYVSMGLWFPISVWCSNWPRFRQGELLQTGFHIFFIFSIKLGGFPCFLAQQDAPCSSCFFLIQERIPVISLF